MARQRERFDRVDVPTPGRYTNLIGLVVVVVAFAVVALVVTSLWNRVQLEFHLEDGDLEYALSGGSDADAPGGYVASEDQILTALVLNVSSLDDDATLESARVYAYDLTTGAVNVADVPLSTKVTSDDTSYALSDLYAASGANACVWPLVSATGIALDHAVVAAPGALDELAQTSAQTEDLLAGGMSVLGLLRTDMDNDELLTFGSALRAAGGASALPVAEATLSAETTQAEDGSLVESGFYLLDTTSLRAALGLIVHAG